MNLLQNRIPQNNDNEIYSNNFRRIQYNHIEYFMKLCIEYISQLNNNYLECTKTTKREILSYRGMYNSEITEFAVYVKSVNDGTEKVFTKILIPTLIHDNFFILNDNLYVPAMYVTDLPIVTKNKSTMLTSLFNSITLYMKDDIAIFTGVNIPLENFLSLFLMDNEDDRKLYSQFIAKNKLKHNQNLSEQNIVNYFEKKFNTNKNKESVIKFLENAFFDDYTKRLYKSCYNFDKINLQNIIRQALLFNINGNPPSFIDLNHKRVIFIELLLRPLFERIAGLIKQLIAGYKIDEISMNQLVLIKSFLTSKDMNNNKKGLSGNYLYNTSNLFSGVLQHKVCMIQPGVRNAPTEVQGMHTSHFGKICPISVSSQNPGEIVSIIPGTKLNKHGLFID